jgi:arginase family enzyme
MSFAGPTYHVLGVPLRSGSHYPGNENDAQGYRDAGLVARLQAAGCEVMDEGDVAIPSYLPHHTVPPIRSWPGPRIAWECVGERIAPLLQQPGHVPLLIGCDCSVVVGTAQALARVAGENVHILYIDGDFDDETPRAEKCQSAAALAGWLVTQGAPFCAGPVVPPSRMTVIGWNSPSEQHDDAARARAVSLTELRQVGPRVAAQRVLDALPASASIVLHFDTDVFSRSAMPSTYFPHEEGLTLEEGTALLEVLLRDSRIRIIEVAEYASLRDGDRRDAKAIVEVLAAGLAPQRLSPQR